ncbi:MAG: hypothetical protein ACWGG5_07525 [Stenotrophomonas sp.]
MAGRWPSTSAAASGWHRGRPCRSISPFSAEEFARDNWSINEDIDAVYVQADFSFDKLRGNFGVRYVRTDLESRRLRLQHRPGRLYNAGMVRRSWRRRTTRW